MFSRPATLPTIAAAVLTCCSALALAGQDPSALAATKTAILKVTVSGIRNEKGQLACLLFATPNGFPERAELALRTARVSIRNGTAECRFADLPAGEYAVMALHDENDNKKMDRNLLGMPKEGYGPSNNVTRAMSPPKWSEARFVLEPGAELTTQITLRY
jgi:uncharacterized protein (DUF2141 family)